MSEPGPHENPFPPIPERTASGRTAHGGSRGAKSSEKRTDVSDETLMMCVQGGDLTSLQELMLRYERALYGFLARYTGDAHLAEDLFQDCFVRLVQSRAAFDPDRGFRPWLYSVAANLARDACRRREVRSRETGRGGLFRLHLARKRPPGVEVARPDQEAERIEEAEMVREVIDELPSDARAMVLLHFFQGLTYKEVASAVGSPVGTVKSRMHWAVRKLADKWNERAASAAAGDSPAKRRK